MQSKIELIFLPPNLELFLNELSSYKIQKQNIAFFNNIPSTAAERQPIFFDVFP